jgi:hypothetical protein
MIRTAEITQAKQVMPYLRQELDLLPKSLRERSCGFYFRSCLNSTETIGKLCNKSSICYKSRTDCARCQDNKWWMLCGTDISYISAHLGIQYRLDICLPADIGIMVHQSSSRSSSIKTKALAQLFIPGRISFQDYMDQPGTIEKCNALFALS